MASRSDFNEGKTKSPLPDRRHEQMNYSEAYYHMQTDEKSYAYLRKYNPEIRYKEDIINVYKFLIQESKEIMLQREQTCFLAMEYFLQTMIRCPNLRRNEIGIIAAAALMVASKFDELDYSLLPASDIIYFMKSSPAVRHYDNTFDEKDLIECEKNILDRLDWRIHQYTAFHFLENFIMQGIDINFHDSLSERKWSGDMTTNVTNSSFESSIPPRASKNMFQHPKSLNRSFQSSPKFMNKAAGATLVRKQINGSHKATPETKKTPGNRMNSQEVKKFFELWEYLIKLSCIILETQDFKASKVAAAWVMTSRKIMNVQPIWWTQLETITSYTYIDLTKWVNLLLDNYNSIKINGKVFPVSEIFGRQPYAYKKITPIKSLLESEKLNIKWNGSVSPTQSRVPIRPKLSLKKIKSTIDETRSRGIKRNNYDTYLQMSPSGILGNLLKKKRKWIQNNSSVSNVSDLKKASFSKFAVIHSDDDSDTSSDTSSSIGSKKIWFKNIITVIHGSKKLIEEINDTEEGPKLANKTRWAPKPFLLQKNNSWGQKPSNPTAKSIYDKYKTPLDTKLPRAKSTLYKISKKKHPSKIMKSKQPKLSSQDSYPSLPSSRLSSISKAPLARL